MSNMQFVTWLLVLGSAPLAITGCATNRTSVATAGSDLSVKVALESHLRLAVEIQNKSGVEIVASKDSLPWEWRYSFWVKAFVVDAGGSPVDERLPISDPSRTESVRIAPGARMEGHIDLESRFPDLRAALEKHDVVIFWSYQPEFEPIRAPRVAGWLTIPKA